MTFMKAVRPHTMTKVFQRNKNSVWQVKNAGVVKLVLEENNQLTHMERATKHVRCFTREFLRGGKENSFHKVLPIRKRKISSIFFFHSLTLYYYLLSGIGKLT